MAHRVCTYFIVFYFFSHIQFFFVALAFQIVPEKPLELRVKACTHALKPYLLDTMLFFPPELKYCVTLETTKRGSALAKDTRRTTFLQSSVVTSLREIGSPHRCQINFMGYSGEYRIAPDFGYYVHCQQSLSDYTNQLMSHNDSSGVVLAVRRHGVALPTWNISNPNCPIQALPNSYMDFLSCDLHPNKWYELYFASSIQYEIYRDKYYHQLWANYSTTFLFKTEKYVERFGSELYWLQQLVQLRVKLSHDCTTVRYLLNADKDWPLRIRVYVDYQVRENAYVKHLRHIGNGTLDKWFSGIFAVWPQRERTHEVCVQLVWQGSRNRFRLCRVFANRNDCANLPAPPSSNQLQHHANRASAAVAISVARPYHLAIIIPILKLLLQRFSLGS